MLVRAGWEALLFVFIHTWLSNETVVVPLPFGLADSSDELMTFIRSRALAPGERPPDRPEDLPQLSRRPGSDG